MRFIGVITVLSLFMCITALAKDCLPEENRQFTASRQDNLYLKQDGPFSVTDVGEQVIAKAFKLKAWADSTLLRAGLIIPARVNITPCYSAGCSIYLYSSNVLRFTVATREDPNWITVYSDPDEDRTGPTFIHEYGHAVFWNSLTQFELPWPELKLIAQKHHCEEKNINSKEEFDSFINRWSRELSAIYPGSTLNLYAIHQIVVPYTEFYSDLIAALAYNNAAIMRWPINAYTSISDEALNRDFSEPLKKVSATPTQHEWFSEARYELYRLAWKTRLSDDEKVQILKTVFTVFKNDIEEKWRKGNVNEPRTTQVNRIILKFREAFN